MAVFPVNDDKTMAFQCMVRKLEDFCKDLPLDIFISYIYDTEKDEDDYYVNISDYESYENRMITYIGLKYYPKTDIYSINFRSYLFEEEPKYLSTLCKSYSPTNHDTEIKSTNDIYEMIIKHIKKGIFGYEMDKENK